MPKPLINFEGIRKAGNPCFKKRFLMLDADKKKQYRTKYREENREKHRRWNKKSYLKNREKNREKNKERSHSFYINNKDKFWGYNLKSSYNLSVEKYNQLFVNQNGLCAICKAPVVIGKKLVVDHCHKTGKIRGLLCYNCNNGIGNFRDNVNILSSAIKYLTEKRFLN
jgi:hypothetical protein